MWLWPSSLPITGRVSKVTVLATSVLAVDEEAASSAVHEGTTGNLSLANKLGADGSTMWRGQTIEKNAWNAVKDSPGRPTATPFTDGTPLSLGMGAAAVYLSRY